MSNTNNAKESQSSQNSQNSSDSHNTTDDATDNTTATKRPGPMEVLRQARGQLAELTGMEAESVSSFEQTEEGWALEVEVLELERVPDTMSLMASYQVQLDPDGQLTGYRRVRRYERGRADAHRPGGR
ncbi:gas vesicle protein [Streptomyces sp. NPDC014986]|uniref:gas vesicle protein GvpO n=1 Tax=Streptomyces sp. NPDC014986 TaxID=3364934 RepID=UPI0036F57397